jgi:hypothetical protein
MKDEKAYNIFTGNSEGKRPHEIFRRKWENNSKTYCHVYEFIRDFRRVLDWMIGFIDILHTPLGTTGKYSAIADLHIL